MGLLNGLTADDTYHRVPIHLPTYLPTTKHTVPQVQNARAGGAHLLLASEMCSKGIY